MSYKPSPEDVAALTTAESFLGKVIESVQNPVPEGVPAPVSWLIRDTD